jgi:multisubunit Na+/H+ antiporter MnhG subunit
VTGDPDIIYRAILIAAFLLVTTPISAFVIARAALLRGERMETPGALDESGRDLPRMPDY